MLAPTNLSAQTPAPNQQAFWIKVKADLEKDRDELRLVLADSRYKVAFVKYIAKTGPVNDVLDAAHEVLLKGLAVGDGGHAIVYENRIVELEGIATRNLGIGTGTQNELDRVRHARLDSVLNNLLPNIANPTNGG